MLTDFSASQAIGGDWPSPTPEAPGPRNDGQFIGGVTNREAATSRSSREEASGQLVAKPREPKLSPNQRVMFRLLHEAGSVGLTTEEWSEKAREVGITTKQRTYELRMALKDKEMVREYAGRWFVSNG